MPGEQTCRAPPIVSRRASDCRSCFCVKLILAFPVRSLRLCLQASFVLFFSKVVVRQAPAMVVDFEPVVEKDLV